MIRFFRKFFDKILTKFTLTYLLLFFTAIGLSVVIVNAPIKKIGTDILNSNLTTLKQKSSLIDQKLSNVEKVSCQICSDAYITQITPIDSDGQFYMDMKAASDQLLIYRNKLDEDFIDDIFVYYTNFSYIATPDTCYNADFFHSYVVKPADGKSGSKEALTNFFTMLTQKHPSAISDDFSISYENKNMNIITDITTIPMLQNSGQVENLCILIQKNYFDQTFSRAFSNSGYLQVYNKSGRLLYTINYGGSKTVIPKNSLTGGKGDYAANRRFDGQNLTIVSTVSKQSGWKYVWVQPQSIAMKGLISMRNNIILLFTVTLIIGVIVAFLLAYYNSRPIFHIAESINRTNATPDNQCNTFKKISDSLNILINDKLSFEQKLEQQKPLLQNVIASQLLNGNYESFELVCANCEDMGFPINSGCFLVCAVSFLGYDDSEYEESGVVRNVNTAKTCFKELIQKTLMGRVLYNDTSLTDMALIANFVQKGQIEQFSELLSHISRELLKQYGTMIVIGISNPNCSSPANLVKSYQEALEALNYVQFDQKERIVRYSDIPVRKIGYYYPIELEQRIVNSITLGNLENLDAILKIIIVENFEKRQLTNYAIKHLYYDFLSTCFHLEDKISIDSDLNRRLKKAANCNFINRNSFDEMLTILQSFCTTFASMKSDRNKTFIQKILDYINKNYDDQNLSLTNIASKFSISSGYLSTFFKKQTGKNFTEYIETTRIDAASKLLKKTDMTINEICFKVGFSNINSFRRSFEGVMGMSPKTARQLYRNS